MFHVVIIYFYFLSYIQGDYKPMIQTLKVYRGYCKKHCLYRNVWAQFTRWGTYTRRRHKKNVFDSTIGKYYVYRKFSNMRQPIAIHAWQLQWSDCYTDWNETSISRIRNINYCSRINAHRHSIGPQQWHSGNYVTHNSAETGLYGIMQLQQSLTNYDRNILK